MINQNGYHDRRTKRNLGGPNEFGRIQGGPREFWEDQIVSRVLVGGQKHSKNCVSPLYP